MSSPEAAPLIADAEVVVVGGGPAGSSCAATLAELGHSVVIVDQDEFPRPKPCGDGLTPPSTDFLARLGLDDVLASGQPIDGPRLITDHERVRTKRYTGGAGMCIPRATLDQALLDAALERGARFVKARVDEPVVGDDGTIREVVTTTRDGAGRIAGRCIVAADGATSRLRRQVGIAKAECDASAYAVRQYCRTEIEPDPLFDVYIPIGVDGTTVAGYGWVFPVGPREVNVGVGLIRGSGIPGVPLRRLLASFFDELREFAGERYGALDPQGQAIGSPLGINFAVNRCEHRGMFFVGDAARTTDPLTGEGIAYAMTGGEAIARQVDARLRHRNGARADGNGHGGDEALGAFPRIEQDIGLTARMALRFSDRPDDEDRLNTAYVPLLRSVGRMLTETEIDSSLNGVPVREALAESDPELAEALDRFNLFFLDGLRSRLPFATELVHRYMRSHAGPTYGAAALLSARAHGADLDARAMRAAGSVELAALYTTLTSQICGEAERRKSKFNDAMSVLIADLVAARALVMATRNGRASAEAWSATSCRMCEGHLLTLEDRFDTARTPERYLASVDATRGEVTALAAVLGANAAGATAPAAAGEAARRLAAAFQIGDDLLDLTRTHAVDETPPGSPLADGHHCLATIFALEDGDAELKRMLGRRLDRATQAEAVRRVTGGDAVERAAAVGHEQVEAARAAIGELPAGGADWSVLADVAAARLEEACTLEAGGLHAGLGAR